MKQLSGIITGPLELLFPSYCVLCRVPLEGGEVVCPVCLDLLVPTHLGMWLSDITVQEGLDGVWSACWYDESMETLIGLLKYESHRRIAGLLGQAAWDCLAEEVPWRDYDMLVPVPLHRVRRRERGYNQSALLARALSQECQLPVREDLLRRHRWTASQTGLSVAARRKNVAGCFQATRGVEGQRVLLMDDVLTTGATVSSCAMALKVSGCSEAAVLTVATPRKGD